MNRGIRGERIFLRPRDKTVFLDMLHDGSRKLGITVLGYCLLDSHFHLALENTSGRMGDCLRQVSGRYGIYYRQSRRNQGYVFQGRFKSTLIENDGYLRNVLLYILNNPVYAGLVSFAAAYRWSSIWEILNPSAHRRVSDVGRVCELFGGKEELLQVLAGPCPLDTAERRTEFGGLLGSDEFFTAARERAERRGRQLEGQRRSDDRYFEPVDKIYQELVQQKGYTLETIQSDSREGTRRREELLVALREHSGLTYREIAALPGFTQLSITSLGKLYQRAKVKQGKMS